MDSGFGFRRTLVSRAITPALQPHPKTKGTLTDGDRTGRMTRFTKPKEDAIVFHIDIDVMKERMSLFYLPAQVRVQADSSTVLKQILRGIEQHGAEHFTSSEILQHRMSQHKELLDTLAERELDSTSASGHADSLDLPEVLKALRQHLPENNLVLNESISNYPAVWKYIAPTNAGCRFECEKADIQDANS